MTQSSKFIPDTRNEIRVNMGQRHLEAWAVNDIGEIVLLGTCSMAVHDRVTSDWSSRVWKAMTNGAREAETKQHLWC